MRKVQKIMGVLLSMTILIGMSVVSHASSKSVNDGTYVNQEGSVGESIVLSANNRKKVEVEKKGSITVALSDSTTEGSSKAGVTLSVLKIGVLDPVNGYVLNEEFDYLDLDLNNVKNTQELDSIAKSVIGVADISQGTQYTTDERGRIKFDDLSVGVYLIAAVEDKGYDEIKPAIISIPTYNEKKGEMNYDVTVVPKKEPYPTPEPSILPTPEPAPPAPQTGVANDIAKYLGYGFAVLSALVVYNIIMRKKKSK